MMPWMNTGSTAAKIIPPMKNTPETPQALIAKPLATAAAMPPILELDEAKPKTPPLLRWGVTEESTFWITGCNPPAAV